MQPDVRFLRSLGVKETDPAVRARLQELLAKSREYNRELARLSREIADLRQRAGGGRVENRSQPSR